MARMLASETMYSERRKKVFIKTICSLSITFLQTSDELRRIRERFGERAKLGLETATLFVEQSTLIDHSLSL